jgi:hypothetical protein
MFHAVFDVLTKVFAIAGVARTVVGPPPPVPHVGGHRFTS